MTKPSNSNWFRVALYCTGVILALITTLYGLLWADVNGNAHDIRNNLEETLDMRGDIKVIRWEQQQQHSMIEDIRNDVKKLLETKDH